MSGIPVSMEIISHKGFQNLKKLMEHERFHELEIIASKLSPAEYHCDEVSIDITWRNERTYFALLISENEICATSGAPEFGTDIPLFFESYTLENFDWRAMTFILSLLCKLKSEQEKFKSLEEEISLKESEILSLKNEMLISTPYTRLGKHVS